MGGLISGSSTLVGFVPKTARTGCIIVTTTLSSIRDIVTTSAKRVGYRRTTSVRGAKRGVLRLPGASNGVATRRVTTYTGTCCSRSRPRCLARPGVMCLSFPARGNALCSGGRVGRVRSIYAGCKVCLFISNTHVKCKLKSRGGSLALGSFTRLASMFCVNKAGYNTLFNRTLVVATRSLGCHFGTCVGRGNTMLTGN